MSGQGSPGAPSKREQTGFLGGEGQTKFGQAQRECGSKPLRIVIAFEEDHKVIGKTDELGFAPALRSHGFRKPEVEGIVEIDIPQ